MELEYKRAIYKRTPTDNRITEDFWGNLIQQEKGVTLCQKGKHYKNPF